MRFVHAEIQSLKIFEFFSSSAWKGNVQNGKIL